MSRVLLSLGVLLWAGASVAAAEQPSRGSPRPGRALTADVSGAARLAANWGIVTSTLRTPARNRAVGGAPNSYHLSGRAIDLARRPGVSHAQIEAALRGAGFRLVESLDEGDHSHFAFVFASAENPRRPAGDEVPDPATPPPPPEASSGPRLAADLEAGSLKLDSDPVGVLVPR